MMNPDAGFNAAQAIEGFCRAMQASIDAELSDAPFAVRARYKVLVNAGEPLLDALIQAKREQALQVAVTRGSIF